MTWHQIKSLSLISENAVIIDESAIFIDEIVRMTASHQRWRMAMNLELWLLAMADGLEPETWNFEPSTLSLQHPFHTFV